MGTHNELQNVAAAYNTLRSIKHHSENGLYVYHMKDLWNVQKVNRISFLKF
jgi:hypothetical protein